MSSLVKEDLLKLSIKQLEKYKSGMNPETDAEDIAVVNEVIAEKTNSIDKVKNDPSVATEIEGAKDKKAEIEKLRAEREEAKAKEKAEKEAAALKRKEEKEKEKAVRDEIAELKKKEKAEKDALKAEKDKEKAEKTAARLAKQEELKEARKKAAEEIEQRRIERAEAAEKRAQENAERLAQLSANPKPNKTQTIRQLLAKGFSNQQIAEETGFARKFVCDTVWRIEQEIKTQEYIQKKREEQAASLTGDVSPAEENINTSAE